MWMRSATRVPMVGAISPEVMMRAATVTREYRSQNMTRARRRAGRLPEGSQHDHGDRAMVIRRRRSAESSALAVLGAKAAKKLFGEIPPENEKISINGMQFIVTGVLKTKIQISNYNTPDNECVFIPYGTMSLLHDVKYPEDIVWSPANPMFRAAGGEAGAGDAGAHPQLLAT